MSAVPPIGPVVDATPADRPGPVTLSGSSVRLEKLDPARHGDALWRALKGDDSVWTYMSYGPFKDGPAFAGWLDERAVLLDPYSYAICDFASGEAHGIFTLLEIRPAMRVVEVGNVLLSPMLQRTRASTEAQYLLARYVFDDLGYRRYEWKCNALNAPSRAAAVRLGFAYEGTFRQHMIVKGRNRDTAWFAMTDGDWPAARRAFEAWLAPENFDGEGKQKSGLTALRKGNGKS